MSNQEKWMFISKCCSFGFAGHTITEIEANDNLLNVHTYNEYDMLFVIKTGEHTETIDINDIQEIIYKKSTSYLSIFLILAGLVFLTQGNFWGIALLLYGGFTLKSKNMCMYHKHGMIKMSEQTDHSGGVESFFSYVRRYNPDCVKVYIEH